MARKATKAKAKPRVAEATGMAGAGGAPGLGKAIEEAMAKAVLKAQADGVTDPNKIREAMMAARKEVVE